MKVLFDNLNGVLDGVTERFEHAKNIEEADAFVTWQDIEGMQVSLIERARQRGIPSIVVAHGPKVCRDYLLNPQLKPIADKYLVWGEGEVERLVSAGVAPERIAVTGSTVIERLKILLKNGQSPVQPKKVLFVAAKWQINYEISENYKVRDALRKIPRINVITKTLKYENDPEKFDNPIESDRNSPDHVEKCIESVLDAFVVIQIQEGTMSYLAYCLGIPVLTVDVWRPRYGVGRMVIEDQKSLLSKATKLINLEDLEDEIEIAASPVFLPGSEKADEYAIPRMREADYECNWHTEESPTERIAEEIKKAVIEKK